MIRTVVIDDEPFIRQGIIKSIEMTNPAFQIIGEAGDGVSALSLIKEKLPDVAFIDINMPVMDGLALIQKLQDMPTKPKCIILSGYSDFTYAQTAIQYQVTDYLLKPISPDELYSTLSSVCSSFENEKYDRQLETLNRIFRGEQIYTDRDSESTLSQNAEETEYWTKNPSEPSKSRLLQKSSSVFQEYCSFYAFFTCFGSYTLQKNNQFIIPDNNHVQNAYTQTLETFKDFPASFWHIQGENPNETLVIIGFNRPTSCEICSTMTNAFFDSFSKLSLPITLVTGKIVSSFEEMISNVIEIKYAFPNIIRFGYSILSSYKDIPPSELEQIGYFAETSKILHHLFNTNQWKEFTEMIRKLFSSCQKQKVTQILLQNIATSLLLIVSRDVMNPEYNAFVLELITNTYRYQDFVQEYMKYLFSILNYQNTEDTADFIVHMKEYIDNHYTEELSLNLLSEKFHVSVSHFSVQFKKRFGVSPNEYIIKNRIQLAKELLSLRPALTVKQVSGMVGYSDPYYFSRIFKTNCGISPTEFQQSKDTTLS